ncbi:hypothetical protein Esti_000951 [Eimeria stiedai]
MIEFVSVDLRRRRQEPQHPQPQHPQPQHSQPRHPRPQQQQQQLPHIRLAFYPSFAMLNVEARQRSVEAAAAAAAAGAAAMPTCSCFYHKRLGDEQGLSPPPSRSPPAGAVAAAAAGAREQQQQQLQQQQGGGICGKCEGCCGEAAACSCRKRDEEGRKQRRSSWLWGPLKSAPLGASLKTPKELLLVLYMVSAMLTSCVYFGFPSIRRMLLQAGAYEWLCGEETDSPAAAAAEGEAAEEDRIHAKCRAQDAEVAPLFTVALVSHSLMSAVAGTLLDHAGPKLTALVGQSLNILGWALLGLSSKRMPAYIPAFICIGAGADTCYLPLLKIVSLFQRSGVVIALLGVACTSSFALPVILERMWTANAHWRFSDVCGVYLLLGPGVGLSVALLFIPWKSFPPSKTNSRKQTPCLSLCESGSSIPLSLTTLATDAAADPQPPLETTAAAGGGGASLSHSACIDVPDASHLVQRDCSSGNGSKSRSGSSKSSCSKTTTCTIATTASSSKQQQQQLQLQQQISRQSFLSEFLSIRFLCIPVLAAVQQLAISFYHMSAHRLLEPQVSRHLDIFLSLACIPCVLLGIAIDLFGILPVLAFSNFLGLCAYAVTLGAPAYTLHMVSLVSFCGYVALDSELVFCCVSYMFSSGNFGRLAGLAQAAGGLLSLISIPLYNSVSMHWYNGNCKPVAFGLTLVLACVFPIQALLWWLQRRLAAAAAGEQQAGVVNAGLASKEIQLTAASAAPDAAAAAGRQQHQAQQREKQQFVQQRLQQDLQQRTKQQQLREHICTSLSAAAAAAAAAVEAAAKHQQLILCVALVTGPKYVGELGEISAAGECSQVLYAYQLYIHLRHACRQLASVDVFFLSLLFSYSVRAFVRQAATQLLASCQQAV